MTTDPIFGRRFTDNDIEQLTVTQLTDTDHLAIRDPDSDHLWKAFPVAYIADSGWSDTFDCPERKVTFMKADGGFTHLNQPDKYPVHRVRPDRLGGDA